MTTPAPLPPDELLTVEEAAAELKLHPQTIRALYRAGDLPVVRLGRIVRIPRSGIDALIERAEDEAAELRSATA